MALVSHFLLHENNKENIQNVFNWHQEPQKLSIYVAKYFRKFLALKF